MKNKYFPTATNNCEKSSDTETTCEEKGIYPCPCCDYITFPVPKEEALSYICPVCFWENDVFTLSDDEPSDENHGMTLNEGRSNFRLFGACTQDMLIHVRNPKLDEIPK
ncbi:MAG: CPCC family cysteine-rich protein [Oscillospiraceae bacterium]